MRLLALQKHYYLADVYTYTGSDDSRVYAFYKTVPVTMGSNLAGRVMNLYADEALQKNARVLNLRDRGGELVLPTTDRTDGAWFQVADIYPVLNGWGFREGFRHSLVRMA